MNRRGFTIVELMGVLAVVGVLATVGITNYQKYAARSRQAEVKITLSAVFTTELAYRTEMHTFTLCLRQIGFNPDTLPGATSKKYYSVNMQTAGGSICGPTGTQSCFCYTYSSIGACELSCTPGTDNVFLSNASISGGNGNYTIPTLTTGTDTFQAVSWGKIAHSDYSDVWLIDHTKTFTNYLSGL